MASVPKPSFDKDARGSECASPAPDERIAAGVLTPVPIDAASTSSAQASDAPTLVGLPVAYDTPTVVSFNDPREVPINPSDAATQIDVSTRKSALSTPTSGRQTGLRAGAVLANRTIDREGVRKSWRPRE